MSEFLKMDVFFFVTTVAVVVVALCVAIVSWRFWRILKNIEHISEQAAREADTIHLDLIDLRANIRRGEGRLKSLFGFLGKTTKRASKDT